ncbi:MAG: lysyl oxidase family protein [Gaiellaceae bacterium]
MPHRLRVVERDGRLLLGFASAVDNVGTRPLVIEGRRTARFPGMLVRQLVGGRRVAFRGALRYVRSPDHAHWHLLGFERYELRRPDGRRVRRDRKTGFCLTDSYDADARMLPGEPRRAVWTAECGRHHPDLLRVRAGISVGFRDVYHAFLEGQEVDITGLRTGRYVLVHRVNPRRALRESRYENNAASVLLSIRGARVRVLAHCPDSARCDKK